MTNRRMADDRDPWYRSESIAVSKVDTVMFWYLAISLSDFQNASSRLILFSWPAITTDRFTTRDFKGVVPRSDLRRGKCPANKLILRIGSPLIRVHHTVPSKGARLALPLRSRCDGDHKKALSSP